jgi:hypothetical protein
VPQVAGDDEAPRAEPRGDGERARREGARRLDVRQVPASPPRRARVADVHVGDDERPVLRQPRRPAAGESEAGATSR